MNRRQHQGLGLGLVGVLMMGAGTALMSSHLPNLQNFHLDIPTTGMLCTMWGGLILGAGIGLYTKWPALYTMLLMALCGLTSPLITSFAATRLIDTQPRPLTQQQLQNNKLEWVHTEASTD